MRNKIIDVMGILMVGYAGYKSIHMKNGKKLLVHMISYLVSDLSICILLMFHFMHLRTKLLLPNEFSYT